MTELYYRINSFLRVRIFFQRLVTWLATAAFVVPSVAMAQLAEVGPGNPENGFPYWYSDVSGQRLALCSDPADANCIVLADAFFNPEADLSFPSNFPSELFYWFIESEPKAVGSGGSASLRLVLEATFAEGGPVENEQMTFLRVNLPRFNDGDLSPNSTYQLTYPFGVATFDTDAGGASARFRLEEGCAIASPIPPNPACDFANLLSASQTHISGFLRAINPPPPPGYLGNPNVSQTITPGPLGDFFKLEVVAGEGIAQDQDPVTPGTQSFVQTNRWAVAGKLFSPFVSVNTLITSDTTPLLTGNVSDVNAEVMVQIGESLVLNGANNGNGTWSASLTTPLTDGAYDVLVMAHPQGGQPPLTNADSNQLNALVVDTTEPVVTGVSSGSVVSTDVVLDAVDASALNAQLNGLPFILGTQISEEGSYVSVITDEAGNASTVAFKIDKTAPAVTGVNDGAMLNKSVSPVLSDVSSFSATLNGAPFTMGTTISDEGSYSLVATDIAGNIVSVGFVIDKTAPLVAGVAHNSVVNVPVAPVFSDPSGVLATLNGNPFFSGTAIVSDGSYTLSVSDPAGNRTVVTFTIDRVAPVVTGLLDYAVYTREVVAVFNEGIGLLDGLAYASGTPIATEGAHELEVRDQAGNTRLIRFVIDTPLLVKNLKLTEIGPRSADLSWETTSLAVGKATWSTKLQGRRLAQARSASAKAPGVSHRVTLRNLKPGTHYYVKVAAQGKAFGIGALKKAESAVVRFKTKASR